MDSLHKLNIFPEFLLRVLTLIFLVQFGGFPPNLCEAQAETRSSPTIDQFLQEADKHFELQDFQISFKFYRNVLALDPLHQYARERIYEITKIYHTLEEVAIQQQNQEQARLFHQEYRTIIRYLLTLLTNQLQHFLERYAEYLKLDVQDEETRKNILEVLKNILMILREIQVLYEQFPQDEASSTQMVERIKQTIDKYQQEYARYESPEQQ